MITLEVSAHRMDEGKRVCTLSRYLLKLFMLSTFQCWPETEWFISHKTA